MGVERMKIEKLKKCIFILEKWFNLLIEMMFLVCVINIVVISILLKTPYCIVKC